MSMHNFSAVLSGNCLLLLSTDLEECQRRDALDAQLFAWLNASSEFLLLDENEQWHGTYMDRHVALGWVVSTRTEKHVVSKETVGSTPLAIVWSELASLVPAQVAPALNSIRKRIQELPSSHPAWQVLSTEALESLRPLLPAGGDPITRIALEVRVVMPGPRVFSSSLFLETSQHIEAHWLTQTLKRETITHQVTRHFAGELFSDVFAGVRTPLQERLKTLRATYVVPVCAAP
ncbi:hypothetical protein [Pseudomonas sp. H9]|uniref:hypothetical protein n=1 Tax=Pseudomonas sp. H9 TaxID=483968 RepID=UPI0010576AAA|nr:hypothetical protein [Pseudomonas sp. H9]TDF85362.1 hypothetical protein E1573_04835 [Pseudomonas sp. H9]